ncbi:hypothetical protein Hypma_009530 [Hypsizygus marmoreus]|uniref:Uncharacterized protein n=1 Tax=Hypsizygus marmoreus TaxID=39966 RepID=A0A369JVK8_HYPMA|nr:hypothetical protein Hypma_009530 [Hypsizygus marmoreus]
MITPPIDPANPEIISLRRSSSCPPGAPRIPASHPHLIFLTNHSSTKWHSLSLGDDVARRPSRVIIISTPRHSYQPLAVSSRPGTPSNIIVLAPPSSVDEPRPSPLSLPAQFSFASTGTSTQCSRSAAPFRLTPRLESFSRKSHHSLPSCWILAASLGLALSPRIELIDGQLGFGNGFIGGSGWILRRCIHACHENIDSRPIAKRASTCSPINAGSPTHSLHTSCWTPSPTQSPAPHMPLKLLPAGTATRSTPTPMSTPSPIDADSHSYSYSLSTSRWAPSSSIVYASSTIHPSTLDEDEGGSESLMASRSALSSSPPD